MPHEKSFSWHYAMRGVLQYADPWAVRYVEPAFSGDPEAVLCLAAALSNDKRGAVAVAMWGQRYRAPRFARTWEGPGIMTMPG
jgi:hypothetical protein